MTNAMLGWTKKAGAIDIRVATQRVNQIFNTTINIQYSLNESMVNKKTMRGSYSGNTLAFQANADSSILLPRSNIII